MDKRGLSSKRIYLARVVCFVGIICSCILTLYDGINVIAGGLLSSIPVLVFLIYLGVAYLIERDPVTEACFWMMGFAFAFFQALGIYFIKKSEGISLKPVAFIFILALICCTCLYANIFGCCYKRITNMCIHYVKTEHCEKEKKDRLVSIGVFLVQIMIWIPYAIIFYPGRVGGDSAWAINCFMTNAISDRHPVFYTYLAGMIEHLGIDL